MRAPLLALVLLAAALAGPSCARREASPADAYRAFVRAVADRDADRAWGLLSADTRAWLDARARAAAARAAGVVPSRGRDLLLGAASRAARPVAEVVVLRESRDRALLQVREEGAPPREVEVVNEGGWRVRLAPPPPP